MTATSTDDFFNTGAGSGAYIPDKIKKIFKMFD